MNKLFDLSGKVALVTGARTGLGRGMAEALASAGADIVGVDIGDLAETEAGVKALGRKFFGYQVDLSKTSAIAKLVDDVVAKAGHIDILVNNAGIIRREDFLKFSEKDWDQVMDINIKAVFVLSQAVANHMVANKIAGRIISTASMLSFQGGIRVPSYTSSKSAVAGLTKLMANELSKYGITANAIAPGYMATDNTAPIRADAARSNAILERIPANRWGLPEDLATAVIFLAAPGSSYVTGTILPVDGGWLAR
jgi:2-dehydro-3-deoxy-D-gluconate 5-dehydrogenase